MMNELTEPTEECLHASPDPFEEVVAFGQMVCAEAKQGLDKRDTDDLLRYCDTVGVMLAAIACSPDEMLYLLGGLLQNAVGAYDCKAAYQVEREAAS